MHIEDVRGVELWLLVIDPALDGMPAERVVKEVLTRFPAGTAVAIVGFNIMVHCDSFALACDLADENCAVHRLGAVDLPLVKLCQVRRSFPCCSALGQGVDTMYAHPFLLAPSNCLQQNSVCMTKHSAHVAIQRLRSADAWLSISHACCRFHDGLHRRPAQTSTRFLRGQKDADGRTPGHAAAVVRPLRSSAPAAILPDS